MDGENDVPVAAWRRPMTAKAKRVAVTVGVAGALLVAGIGIAAAQSGSTTTTVPGPKVAAPGPGFGGRFGGKLGPFGKFGGFGPGGVLHGEFTTSDGNGGYRTVDVQTGQVTDVSSSSITVKSADNFTKTYKVTENTVVDAGRDGIGTVKNGDTVGVNASVSGDTATAMTINDETSLGNIRHFWNPNAPTPAKPSGFGPGGPFGGGGPSA